MNIHNFQSFATSDCKTLSQSDLKVDSSIDIRSNHRALKTCRCGTYKSIKLLACRKCLSWTIYCLMICFVSTGITTATTMTDAPSLSSIGAKSSEPSIIDATTGSTATDAITTTGSNDATKYSTTAGPTAFTDADISAITTTDSGATTGYTSITFVNTTTTDALTTTGSKDTTKYSTAAGSNATNYTSPDSDEREGNNLDCEKNGKINHPASHLSNYIDYSNCTVNLFTTKSASSLEAVVSIWVDKSGSARGIVPEMTFEHMTPLLHVFSQLEAASLSIGTIGSATRDDLAFLTFNKKSSLTPPKRKSGERPSDYQKRLVAFKKRIARKSYSSTYEQKINKFSDECRQILAKPKDQQSSLICEALNVTKRQLNQVNVSETTSKFVLFVSDMYSNGFEKCPLNLGDAELIIVNRLSNPHDLMFHRKTRHFISIEEAIDYIASNI